MAQAKNTDRRFKVPGRELIGRVVGIAIYMEELKASGGIQSLYGMEKSGDTHHCITISEENNKEVRDAIKKGVGRRTAIKQVARAYAKTHLLIPEMWAEDWA